MIKKLSFNLGIEKSKSLMKPLKAIINITQSAIGANIKTNRKTLEEELDSENLKDSIILIDFDKVCSNYNKCPDLYANLSHLNNKGNGKLAQVIVNLIIEKITPR